MSYAAYTVTGRAHVAQGSSLSHTLTDAVAFVSQLGKDVEVLSVDSGATLWFIEADSKVDDATDQWFPVIVHRREGSSDPDAEARVAAMREP